MRQTKIRINDEDRLCVGDTVIPGHLEKWVWEPSGDHKARHKRQREKEERIAAWQAEHGMYQKKKQQVRGNDPDRAMSHCTAELH